MEDEKVRIPLKKVPLQSEREEIKHKRNRRVLVSLLCVMLTLAGVLLGFGISRLLSTPYVQSFSSDKLSSIETYLNTYWLYHNDYDDLKTALEDKAYDGMLSFEDDPYTSYMSSEEYNDFVSSIDKNYVGIGTIVSDNVGDGNIIVTHVFKNSPAEEAGMLSGDLIVSVDGHDCLGTSIDHIKSLIVGEAGTDVNVTVFRNNEYYKLTMTRAAINSTVYAEIIDNQLVLNIMSFGTDTADEIISYLDSYPEYDSLIIDLRNNTGGYETSVREVCGLFLGEDKVILNEIFADGSEKVLKSICKKKYDFDKIVVLTNSNTASAAEVCTIALKELHPNCIQVGETTYGKGVVQSSYMLSDGSVIKITTSYWTSPDGLSFNKEGIVPDVEVKLDEVLTTGIYTLEEGKTLEYDDVDTVIKTAQMGLKYLGYDLDRTDGYFDKSFEEAVKLFQESIGHRADGILDKETVDSIYNSIIYTFNSDYTKDAQLYKAIELAGE